MGFPGIFLVEFILRTAAGDDGVPFSPLCNTLLTLRVLDTRWAGYDNSDRVHYVRTRRFVALTTFFLLGVAGRMNW